MTAVGLLAEQRLQAHLQIALAQQHLDRVVLQVVDQLQQMGARRLQPAALAMWESYSNPPPAAYAPGYWRSSTIP